MLTQTIRELFGPEGQLSKSFGGFEYREQQQQLALRVAHALEQDSGYLLGAEAPTGVGKSFALLAPAMLWAGQSDGVVLFLTASIPLQEQLLQKDIPRLAELLQLEIPFGLIKGRGNYVCRLKAQDLEREGYLSYQGDGGEVSRRVLEWIRETETGDMAELEIPTGHPVLARIASNHRNCLGAACPFREDCFVSRILQKAQSWRVVVANYHLFFSYLLGARRPFPVSFDVLLCDEAHNMAEAARSSSSRTAGLQEWGRLLSRKSLNRFTPVIDGAHVSPDELARKTAEALPLLEQLFGNLALRWGGNRTYTEIPHELRRDASEVLNALGGLGRLLDRVNEKDMELDETLKAEFGLWKDEFRQTADDLIWCLDADSYPRWAYWWDGEALVSAPTRCDRLVRDAVEQTDPRSIVATSATMTLEGDFSFWVRETGLEPSETLCLDSPFNLAEQMQIWVVDVGLRVVEDGYDDRVARVVERLCDDNGGSTLVLLSSHRLLRAVAERMRSRARGYAVLVQGDLPRSFLLEQFRRDETSVLIGSVSFREGIDVPGAGLSQVIIDRIPFPHPRDPLVQARDELEDHQGFVRVTLPTAKLLLRQAAGRLIRSGNDKGRAVILDSRVLDRSSWRVAHTLPRVPFRKMEVKP